MSKDCIMTFINGVEFCKKIEVEIFLRSFENINFKGDLIIFYNDLDPEFLCRIKNFKPVKINVNNDVSLLKDRHFIYKEFLQENNYDYVFLTDSKDVIFQDNPQKYKVEKVGFCAEGMKHKESDFNRMEQELIEDFAKVSESIPYDNSIQDKLVLNGGVIIGESYHIKEVISNIFVLANAVSCMDLFSLGGRTLTTDQGCLNYLYHHFWYSKYHLFNPETDNFCLTGEAVDKNNIKFKPEFNKFVYHPERKIPYCIFHQWERTQLRHLIYEEFNF